MREEIYIFLKNLKNIYCIYLFISEVKELSKLKRDILYNKRYNFNNLYYISKFY